MKKAILGIIVFGLLSGCSTSSSGIKEFQSFKEKQSIHKYFVKVMSPTTGIVYMAAGSISFNASFERAIEACKREGVHDCIIHTQGNTKFNWVVYDPPPKKTPPPPPSREDKMIAKARNICKKIGVTPGTDKFIDCTIKMMSTSSGQQTVIVGQRKRTSIYPLHCRQMGGMSNC